MHIRQKEDKKKERNQKNAQHPPKWSKENRREKNEAKKQEDGSHVKCFEPHTQINSHMLHVSHDKQRVNNVYDVSHFNDATK